MRLWAYTVDLTRNLARRGAVAILRVLPRSRDCRFDLYSRESAWFRRNWRSISPLDTRLLSFPVCYPSYLPSTLLIVRICSHRVTLPIASLCLFAYTASCFLSSTIEYLSYIDFYTLISFRACVHPIDLSFSSYYIQPL